MDFRITEEQAALVEGVRDFLSGLHGPEMLRTLDGSESRRSDALWSGLTELGLPGLLVPETNGGIGLTLVDAALIAVECGRAGVAEPIVDTAFVAVPWLIANGLTGRLGEITAGDLRVALAHPVNPWIADLDQADAVIGSGRLLPKRDAGDRVDSIDPLRRLFAAGGPVESDDLLLDLAALMTAAQLVGLADGMLALAVDYAKTRQQFGQPIGAFQAIKHHLATAAVKIAFAKPLLQRAAVALDTGQGSASVHVSHAKLAAADTAVAVAETAIQVHGAMGYTYEVDLHFWMKRAWALAGAWGDRGFHLRRIEKAVIDATLPIGSTHTFA